MINSCSGGKLRYEPAHNPSKNIINGVAQITLFMNIAGVGAGYIQRLAKEKLAQKIGSLAPYDHLLFVIPRQAVFPSQAYAGINGKYAVFKDSNYKGVGVVLHELGHNMGLRHSGENNSNQYQDHSCLMGLPR